MRWWPWRRDPDQSQTAEVARVKRLKQQTEAVTDRLARAADMLEQALEQQRNPTMRPGDPWPPRT